jgi:hypothetical protein
VELLWNATFAEMIGMPNWLADKLVVAAAYILIDQIVNDAT